MNIRKNIVYATLFNETGDQLLMVENRGDHGDYYTLPGGRSSATKRYIRQSRVKFWKRQDLQSYQVTSSIWQKHSSRKRGNIVSFSSSREKSLPVN